MTNPALVGAFRKAISRIQKAKQQEREETATLNAFRAQSDALQRNYEAALIALAREGGLSREPFDDALRDAGDTVQDLFEADTRVRILLELVGSISVQVSDVRERKGNRVSEADLTALKRAHFTGLWGTTEFRAFTAELTSVADSFDALRAFRRGQGY